MPRYHLTAVRAKAPADTEDKQTLEVGGYNQLRRAMCAVKTVSGQVQICVIANAPGFGQRRKILIDAEQRALAAPPITFA